MFFLVNLFLATGNLVFSAGRLVLNLVLAARLVLFLVRALGAGFAGWTFRRRF